MFPLLSIWSPSRRAERHRARGRRAEKRGRLEEACRHYRAALAADPGHAAAHLDLGVALEALGDESGAVASYEAALAADPRNPYAAFNLGKAQLIRGQLQAAEARLRSALAGKPDFPEALVVLAGVLEARGNAPDAVACLQAALALRPDYGGALRNLGMLLSRMQRWAEAAAALERAAAADPGDAEAHFRLGNALVHLERVEAAAERYRRVLQLRADHAEAHCHLGNVLADLGRREEAAGHLQRALSLDPRLAQAHVGLGNLSAAEQRFEESASHYRAALESEPRNAQVHVNLGNALLYLGDGEAARVAYQDALSIDPEFAAARWALAMSRVPVMRDAGDDLVKIRADVAREIERLDGWFNDERSAGGHLVVGVQQPFWLAYQEENNVELLRAYGGLCARLMARWHAASGLPPARPHRSGPIRVGVVSQYFRRHSVWDAFVKGWFQGLDRARFELYAFNLGAARDAETRVAESRAVRFVQGPKGLRPWVEDILEAQLDVLIYPEVGMDPTTVKLASLRLAPVQAVSWGHPETTGLPTIDYYLSAEQFEPEAAQANYSERLVALPHLGCRVDREAQAAAPVDVRRWGIPGDAPLLLCPGTPFKYAPEHDALYVEIARRLDRHRLCFFSCGIPELSEKLRRRLARAFDARGVPFERHVSFIPWLPKADFYGLMRRADAMLDTIGFSGFNTALQAVECGLPVVTREGRFLRGRLASGILRRIAVPELVAAGEPEYVELAVRLGSDAGYREQVHRRVEAGRDVLFGDDAPLRALEDFLERAAGYSSDSR